MRRLRWIPRINGEVAFDDLSAQIAAHSAYFGDIQALMPVAVWTQVVCCQLKQPAGGSKPSSILRMLRPRPLFLKMNEPSSELNEALVECPVLVFPLQPEML